jgi:uncharacterized protein involved in exopolysaccharide biosynthesis
MSRIDEALRRLTGGAPEPRNPQGLDRFTSEGENAKLEEPRPHLASRPEPRRLARLLVPASSTDDRRGAATPAPDPPPRQAAERPADKPERVDPNPDVEKLIDVRQVVDYAGFIFRSVGRHKKLAACTFAGVLLLAVTAALLIPKTYHIQVKLLAQRNAVMTALSNPGRAVPWDADAPTRAAAETVLRRDNLISLISQTDLINEWDRRRPPIVRVKDWVRALVTRHEPTADDKLDALVGLLETFMIVSAGPVGDGTVTIDLYWPDAEMGYRIVERARQSYLEARQIAETSAISESITILERYSNSLHQDVNRTISELQATQVRNRNASRRPRAATRRPAAPSQFNIAGMTPVAGEDAPGPDPELMRIKGLLAERRQELSRVEGERNRQLAELQAKLSALLTVYTTTHPSVVTVQQNISAFQKDTPQVAELRKGLDDLEAKYDDLSAHEAERHAKAEALQPTSTITPQVDLTPSPEEGAEEPPAPTSPTQVTEFAGLRLRTELSQLQSILERTDSARIELAVSEAAFKYRYTVIKPAEIPRDPESPNLRFLFAVGLMASVLSGLAVAVGADLISNRILEPWQVERQLGLPILGNVTLG